MSTRLELSSALGENNMPLSYDTNPVSDIPTTYQPSTNDYTFDAETEAQIQQQVDAVAMTTQRQPMLYRQVFTVPGPPGKVRTVVKRLPTPPFDVIEREIYVEEQPDHLVVQIEKPQTPPPMVKERQIIKPAYNKPIVHTEVVKVRPRNPSYLADTPGPIMLSGSGTFNGPITAPVTGPLTPSMSQEMVRMGRYSSQSRKSSFSTGQHSGYQKYF